MLTVLVAGGTGKIGKEAVRALAAREGVAVLVGTRDVAQGAAGQPPEGAARFVELDADRPETLRRALEGVDKLLLVNPLSTTIAAQTRALVDAARAAGVRHLVRSSVLGAGEPDPIEEAAWHGDADQIVLESGIPATLLRPNQYFQNFIGLGTARSVKEKGAIYLPLADARVSNIDTRDIGDAAARVLLDDAAAHAGRSYTLTGPSAHTMTELAEAIGAEIGKPVQYTSVPEEAVRQSMLGAGLPAVIVEAILGWFAYCRAGRAERVTGDAAQLLGRAPRGLADFVRDHASHYR